MDAALRLQEPSQETGHASAAVRATVASPEPRTLRDSVRAIGSVLPRRSVEIRPVVAGRVTEVLFEPGERVEAGDVLFRLDDRAERAALADARATLSERRSEFARVENLVERDVQAEATLEGARAALLRAQAGVDAAENDLDDRRVEAPFAGVIGLSDLDPGERIDPDTVVATLDDLTEVEIEATLSERWFDRVRPGQRVLVTGDGFPGPIDASVEVVAPRVDPGSQSFALRALAPNENRLLVGGMLAAVELVFEERTAPTVPEEAILDRGDETFVFVVEDGVARRTPVRLGLRADDRIEVSGLDPTAKVAVTGLGRLSDGAAVQAVDASGGVDDGVARQASAGGADG